MKGHMTQARQTIITQRILPVGVWTAISCWAVAVAVPNTRLEKAPGTTRDQAMSVASPDLKGPPPIGQNGARS